MIDLKQVRLPVQFAPEDAAKLIELLHDIKTAASLMPGDDRAFSMAREALILVNEKLGANPLEATGLTGDCPWCGQKIKFRGLVDDPSRAAK